MCFKPPFHRVYFKTIEQLAAINHTRYWHLSSAMDATIDLNTGQTVYSYIGLETRDCPAFGCVI